MADGIKNKGQKGGYVVAKFNGSGFLKLNHPTPTIGANSAGETVQEMNIVSAEWSIGNGAFWTVARGANTVLQLTDGQHHFDLNDGRMVDTSGGEPQANVVVTKSQAGAPGTLILKFRKRSSISGGSSY